jgi:hypothetical protein
MRQRNRQVEFVRQLLQAPFPQPTAIAVGAAAIGLDQQFMLAAVIMATNLQPPGANRGNGKRRCFMGRAHHDIAFIVSQIIDAVANRFALRILRKVGLKCLTPPAMK